MSATEKASGLLQSSVQLHHQRKPIALANLNGNTIGPDNIIAHNGGPGVAVQHSDSQRNTITQNSIHDNGSAGIAVGTHTLFARALDNDGQWSAVTRGSLVVIAPDDHGNSSATATAVAGAFSTDNAANSVGVAVTDCARIMTLAFIV